MCVTFPHPVAFGVPSHGSHFTPVMLPHVNIPRHPPRTQIERFAKQLNVSPNTQPALESGFSSVTEHHGCDSALVVVTVTTS